MNWTPDLDLTLRVLWDQERGKMRRIAARMGTTRGSIDGRSRVLGLQFPHGKAKPISPHQDAAVFGATVFPSRVVAPDDNVLKSGANQRKLGSIVTKGKWKGFPIYSLTLEERATCPRSCRQWLTCLTPDARVLMSNLTWQPLWKIGVGDRLAAFDEERPRRRGQRMTKIATVEEVGKATQPCYRIVTTRGTVIASSGHLWLRRRSSSSARWWPTHKITVGDKLQFFCEPWEPDRSYAAGRLRGFVEGEGYLTIYDERGFKKTRTGWSQRPTKLCDEIMDVAKSLGFSVARYERVAGVKHTAISHMDIKGGWKEVVRFIGRLRPTRMIERHDEIWSGQTIGGCSGIVATVLAIEDVGEQEVVTIRTSTGTMVAEGFFTHNCYGNHMGHAKRYAHGPALETQIWRELTDLQAKHPHGFVIRLHILGDFYSVSYVDLWQAALDHFPALHVFGYTARNGDTIGEAVQSLRDARWDRFAVRTSGALTGPRTTVLERAATAGDRIVCPAQVDRPIHKKPVTCGRCALCWSTTKPIVFLAH